MQDANDKKLEIEDKVTIAGKVVLIDKDSVTVEMSDGHRVTLTGKQAADCLKKTSR